MDNEKDTRSQLTWLLPETVESTPKRHLGVLDLMLLSSSRLWKTANNLRMTVQLPLRLGVVIWLVFRSEWEQWSLLHQHGTFTKSGRLLKIAETIFREFLQSLEKVSLTSWSVTRQTLVSQRTWVSIMLKPGLNYFINIIIGSHFNKWIIVSLLQILFQNFL